MTTSTSNGIGTGTGTGTSARPDETAAAAPGGARPARRSASSDSSGQLSSVSSGAESSLTAASCAGGQRTSGKDTDSCCRCCCRSICQCGSIIMFDGGGGGDNLSSSTSSFHCECHHHQQHQHQQHQCANNSELANGGPNMSAAASPVLLAGHHHGQQQQYQEQPAGVESGKQANHQLEVKLASDKQATTSSGSTTSSTGSGSGSGSKKGSFLSRARNSTINLAQLATPLTNRFTCSASVGNLWHANGAHGTGQQQQQWRDSLANELAFDGLQAGSVQPLDYVVSPFDQDNTLTHHHTTTTISPNEHNQADQKSGAPEGPNKLKHKPLSCGNKLFNMTSSSSSSSSSKDKSKQKHKDAEQIEKLRLLVSYLRNGTQQPLPHPVALEAEELELAERYKMHSRLCDDCLQATEQQQPQLLGFGLGSPIIHHHPAKINLAVSDTSLRVDSSGHHQHHHHDHHHHQQQISTSQPDKMFYIGDTEARKESEWTNPQNLAAWIDKEVNSLVNDLEAKSELVKNEKSSKSTKRKWLNNTIARSSRSS